MYSLTMLHFAQGSDLPVMVHFYCVAE